MTPTPPVPELRVAILTALAAETQAVLAHLADVVPSLEDNVVVYRGWLSGAGTAVSVRVTELGPGNVGTGIEAGKLTATHAADILVFVGIAGALKDLAIGDVVAASEVAWIHRAKMEADEQLDRPQVRPCTPELVQVARYTAQAGQWQNRLVDPRDPRPKAFVGQILSGELLIKDAAVREELSHRFSDALAVENEGYALVSAGTAAVKVLVVRGASDNADAEKSDSDQHAAARSAGAFAAQLLHDYLALRQGPTTRQVQSDSAPEEGNLETTGGTTNYDRAFAVVETLRTDIDLIEDEEEAVREFARAELMGSDPGLRVALLEILATELDDESDTLVQRRTLWFGQLVAERAVTDEDPIPWDSVLRTAPRGAAVLLADPAVFNRLGARERRRIISALSGGADMKGTPTAADWRYLIRLIRSDVLTEGEKDRLQGAMLRTLYSSLEDAGLTWSELTPKLLEDLESGDFGDQNRAARYLTAKGDAHLKDQTLPDDSKAAISIALLGAAAMGAWGAEEATRRQRMADWPATTLERALWQALTRGTDRLDFPSADQVKNLLAAATLAGLLDEVLERLLQHEHVSGLRAVSEESAREEAAWLARLGEKLPGQEAERWLAFVTELLEKVPRAGE